MNILQRIIAGHPNRRTRLHDCKGNFVGWRNLKYLPCVIRDFCRRRILQKSINLPWFTYNFIEYLENIVSPEWTVLEYGSGNSTLWFAKRVRFIHSIESDPHWFKLIQSKLSQEQLDNVKYELRTVEHYCDPLNYPDQYYDLIVIDGLQRHGCLRQSIRLLKPGGYIYLDNSDDDIDLPEGDRRLADHFLKTFAVERGANLRYFTGFTVGYIGVHQGMLVQLPPLNPSRESPNAPTGSTIAQASHHF